MDLILFENIGASLARRKHGATFQVPAEGRGGQPGVTWKHGEVDIRTLLRGNSSCRRYLRELVGGSDSAGWHQGRLDHRAHGSKYGIGPYGGGGMGVEGAKRAYCILW